MGRRAQASARVPSRTWNDPVLGCTLHTGEDAVEAVHLGIYPGAAVATDIETPGLEDNFTINCVTFAWHGGDGRLHTALLDPGRNHDHARLTRDVYDCAGSIILHNAAFDTPPLHHAGLLDLDHVDKIIDTVVLARFARPEPLPFGESKALGALAVKYLGLTEVKGGMERAFKAAGFRTQQAGYEGMDIDSPIYRKGAMADTVATLLLEPVLREMCIAWTLDHGFPQTGATTRSEAEAVLGTQELVNRVMLRRSAVGLNVDRDRLDSYAEGVDTERNLAVAELAVHGLEGGVGKGAALVAYLDERGELPANWPRTPKGALSSAKQHLDLIIDHPLVAAQRKLADIEKVMGYLGKVERQASTTGRCHPQVAVLGASATGRMSYGEPPLQQFSGPARGIITDDGQGLTSIDWSQIEPVVMGNMAHDWAFLDPYDRGEDLYEPLQLAAGLPLTKEGRNGAKGLLLSTMYGAGIAKIAAQINHTEESASQLKRQMFSKMRRCEGWMFKIEEIARDHGRIVTGGGRILPVDEGGVFKAVNYECVTPATPILTADLRHVRADNVAVGDQLVGFDEHRSPAAGRGTGKRRFRVSTVTDVQRVVKPCVMVSAGGRTTVCSTDHLWLVRRPGGNVRLHWVRADELVEGQDEMLSLGLWDTDPSRESGYLAGLYDGEGSMSTGRRPQLVFSQNAGKVMDAFTTTMDKLGLDYGYSPRAPHSTSSTDTVRVHGTARVMRTIGTLRPERFVAHATEVFNGVELHTVRQMESVPVVDAVRHLGQRQVMAISTTTRTLVANGWLSHNCQGTAYDVLAATIEEMHRRGISDRLQLAMHDEVVVDTEVAGEVQEIMATPPEWLCRLAGRTPILRTDRADMGSTWQKV